MRNLSVANVGTCQDVMPSLPKRREDRTVPSLLLSKESVPTVSKYVTFRLPAKKYIVVTPSRVVTPSAITQSTTTTMTQRTTSTGAQATDTVQVISCITNTIIVETTSVSTTTIISTLQTVSTTTLVSLATEQSCTLVTVEVHGPTAHAACSPNNIVSTVNGVTISNGSPSPSVVLGSAYECCVACITGFNCASSLF